jgi:hypothetical protein
VRCSNQHESCDKKDLCRAETTHLRAFHVLWLSESGLLTSQMPSEAAHDVAVDSCLESSRADASCISETRYLEGNALSCTRASDHRFVRPAELSSHQTGCPLSPSPSFARPVNCLAALISSSVLVFDLREPDLPNAKKCLSSSSSDSGMSGSVARHFRPFTMI